MKETKEKPVGAPEQVQPEVGQQIYGMPGLNAAYRYAIMTHQIAEMACCSGKAWEWWDGYAWKPVKHGYSTGTIGRMPNTPTTPPGEQQEDKDDE